MAPETPLGPWWNTRIAGGLVGFGGAGNGFATSGTISSASDSWEHPLRTRILNLLERKPGLPYRELQRDLNAANGTQDTI